MKQISNLFLTKKNWKIDRNQDNKYFYKTTSGFNKRPSKSKSFNMKMKNQIQ